MIDFKRRGSKAFYDHYKALCANGLPSRRDLEPHDIPKLLPYVVIGHYESTETLRYRLVGTHVVDNFGLDPTGTNFFEYLPNDIRERWRDYFQRCMKEPAWVYTCGYVNTERGSIYEIENVVFPFKDTNDTITYFIGYCEFLDIKSFGDKKAQGVETTAWHEYRL